MYSVEFVQILSDVRSQTNSLNTFAMNYRLVMAKTNEDNIQTVHTNLFIDCLIYIYMSHTLKASCDKIELYVPKLALITIYTN